jgi:polycomb protein EED
MASTGYVRNKLLWDPMVSVSAKDAFELPKIAATVILEDDTRFLRHPDRKEDSTREIFAVEFCPYQPLDADPVFAVVSKKHVAICKLSREHILKTGMVKTIKLLRDDDDSASNACATWVQDKDTLAPYLCIGGRDGIIKMYDVISAKLVESFTGHGGAINDLTTSPVDPSIFISASNDSTIRLWSINPDHRQQPCLCILGGEGHIAEVLTTAFHDTGQYVLSGGHDHRINMWTIPELPTEPIDTPIQVHYPHFSTSAIHGGIVDWYVTMPLLPRLAAFLC